MKKILLISLFLNFILFANGQSNNFIENYYRNNATNNKSQFLQNFPYDKYLQSVAFTDFNILQEDRLFLWRKFGDGDDFLYNLGERFIQLYPASYNDLSAKTDIGEMYLSKTKGWNNSVDEIYQIIGYFILGKVAQKIEEGLKTRNISLSNTDIDNVINRLEKNKIYIKKDVSTTQKIVQNLSKGNFEYILDRIALKLDEIYGSLGCKVGLKGRWIGAFLILISLLFLLRRRNRTKKKFAILTILFSAIAILSYKFIPNCTASTTTSTANWNTSLSFQSLKSYKKIRGGENAINIYSVENALDKKIGEVVFLERPHIKSNYFAYQNVFNKFSNLKNQKALYTTSSGGYTNANRQPEGLTIENGNIVNAIIKHDTHAIVIIEKSGGLRIINLQKNNIRLPYTNTSISNPLNSLVSFSELLKWAKRQNATLFQTNLLAFSDNLLIKKANAKTQLRERRILAVVSDNSTSIIHYVLFNIREPYNLAEISHEIFNLMKKRNKKVEAILNLDVGSYDILEIYDEQENVLIKGPIPVSNATNLLIFSN